MAKLIFQKNVVCKICTKYTYIITNVVSINLCYLLVVKKNVIILDYILQVPHNIKWSMCHSHFKLWITDEFCSWTLPKNRFCKCSLNSWNHPLIILKRTLQSSMSATDHMLSWISKDWPPHTEQVLQQTYILAKLSSTAMKLLYWILLSLCLLEHGKKWS